jgi:hypothetical protein
MAGLPQDVRATARAAAKQRGDDAGAVITLSRSLIVPFLTFSQRRDLREQAFKAWTRRGENDGEHDNRPVAREILALRNELARLHGYRNYADYALVDRMAGTPAAVANSRAATFEPAKASAAIEARRCGDGAGEGQTHPIEPGTGATIPKKCVPRSSASTARCSPYFALDRMLGAASRHRESAVRHPLRRTPDLPSITPMSAPSKSALGLTMGSSASSFRQLRSPHQARRCVDERLSPINASMARLSSHHRQQQQLRQGCAGRA